MTRLATILLGLLLVVSSVGAAEAAPTSAGPMPGGALGATLYAYDLGSSLAEAGSPSRSSPSGCVPTSYTTRLVPADLTGDIPTTRPPIGVDAGDFVVPERSGLAAKTAAKTCSFAGTTVVLMADGSKKPIDQIQVGDYVLATDPETGEQAAKRVEAVFVHADSVLDLLVDGERITTTEDHPFWSVTDRMFERADQLAPGDDVLGADGRVFAVVGLALESAREALAYNLSVQGVHTYHVGLSEILVHNACGAAGRAANWVGKSKTLKTRSAAEAKARQDAARGGGCFRGVCKSGDHYHVDYTNGRDQVKSTVHYRWRW